MVINSDTMTMMQLLWLQKVKKGVSLAENASLTELLMLV